MDLERALDYQLTRRSVLGLLAGSSGAMLLTSCFSREDDSDDETPDVETDEPEDDDADPEMPEVDDSDDDDDAVVPDDDDDPVEEIDDDDDVDEPDEDDDEDVAVEEDDDDDEEEEEEPEEEPAEEPEIVVADVVEYSLEPEGWDGSFGSVTMRLHRAWANGEEVTFIRTDASDEGFASQHGLVHAPRLSNALDEPGSHADLYLFENAPEDQLPVMSSSPADGETFSPAFRIHHVDVIGKTMTPLASEQEILEASEHGHVTLTSTDIVVNYPVVTWPGGQIGVDDQRVDSLAGGQLIDPPDHEAAQVTLKLHQCHPGGWYIITSASSGDAAASMGVAEAGASRMLGDVDATARLTAFQRSGSDTPGYQPSLMDVGAGDPDASPFREYFVAEWAGEGDSETVDAQDKLDELVDSGDLLLYTGTPDTDPEGFIINSPVLLRVPE